MNLRLYFWFQGPWNKCDDIMSKNVIFHQSEYSRIEFGYFKQIIWLDPLNLGSLCPNIKFATFNYGSLPPITKPSTTAQLCVFHWKAALSIHFLYIILIIMTNSYTSNRTNAKGRSRCKALSSNGKPNKTKDSLRKSSSHRSQQSAAQLATC